MEGSRIEQAKLSALLKFVFLSSLQIDLRKVSLEGEEHYSDTKASTNHGSHKPLPWLTEMLFLSGIK